MKKLINYLNEKIRQWNIAHVVRRISLNLLYYFGILGIYCAWALQGNSNDVKFWVELIIFSVLINIHRGVDDFINK